MTARWLPGRTESGLRPVVRPPAGRCMLLARLPAAATAGLPTTDKELVATLRGAIETRDFARLRG